MQQIAIKCNCVTKDYGKPTMDLNTFLNMTLDELAAKSGIDKTRWCKYFNGSAMNERNIYRFARSVDMLPGEFIDALNKRRKKFNVS